MDRATLIARFEATPVRIVPVPDVPGWGTLHVRAMSLEDMERLNAARATVVGKNHQSALNLAAMLCDEEGGLMFDLDNPDDVALLAKQDATRMQRVFAVVNGLLDGSDKGSTGNA